MELGCDTSNYSGELTATHIEAFKAEGIRFLIAGTQKPVVCKQQLAVAKRAGLEIAAYAYLYFDQLFRSRMNTAIQICLGNTPYLFLWLDVENEESGKNEPEIIALLHEVGEMCDRAGVAWGIYSSAPAWKALTGNCEDFKNVPLWNAQWTGRPDFEDFDAYGGWLKETMRQYLGDTTLAGVKVDMNVRRATASPA